MNRIEINKSKLKSNIQKIYETASEDNKSVKIIAVVKINGMGLGLVEISEFLIDNGIDYLAVADVKEALTLRQAGIKCEILLLTPCANKEEIIELINNDITLTVGSNYEVKMIDSIYKDINKKVNVHIKIDTGLGRYGFIYTDTNNILDLYLKDSLNIKGIYTHFSKTLEKKWTEIQFSRFMNILDILKKNNINTGLRHCANSTAFFLYPHMRLDAVRIGSAWQGCLTNDVGNLKSVATFKTNIIEIKEVPSNYNVSYTNKYKTKSKAKLATIAVGYLDGLNLQRSRDIFSIKENLIAAFMELKELFKTKRLTAVINGHECNIVGKLGTHHAIIDVTNIDCKENDEVILDIKPVMVNYSIKRIYI